MAFVERWRPAIALAGCRLDWEGGCCGIGAGALDAYGVGPCAVAEARIQPVLASLACHGAVRAGRALTLPEIQQLIRDWVQEGFIMTCPHGRRTAFRLSTDELAKLFGRVGWT